MDWDKKFSYEDFSALYYDEREKKSSRTVSQDCSTSTFFVNQLWAWDSIYGFEWIVAENVPIANKS